MPGLKTFEAQWTKYASGLEAHIRAAQGDQWQSTVLQRGFLGMC